MNDNELLHYVNYYRKLYTFTEFENNNEMPNYRRQYIRFIRTIISTCKMIRYLLYDNPNIINPNNLIGGRILRYKIKRY
jgi:hypothetical protein